MHVGERPTWLNTGDFSFEKYFQDFFKDFFQSIFSEYFFRIFYSSEMLFY